MRYEREIEVPTPPEETFAYLADFSTTAEWDPGIAEARRLTPEPTAVGSRFELIAVFRGNRQRFEYVVTELDDGKRIVLRGDGEKSVSTDVITVEPAPHGTRIGYMADIRLKGSLRVVEPFFRPALKRMCDDGVAGLAARLSR
ncbi:MAG TPA: SRPBCC family protein [Gaiellaceae bacterium]|jgi:carbon monoxide dehydrogenase subunit G